MLLGQPAVAAMREALGKLDPLFNEEDGGVDAALAGLEVNPFSGSVGRVRHTIMGSWAASP